MRLALVALCFTLAWAAGGSAAEKAATPPSVWMEELTWMEVRDALTQGYTTALIPTGATEQTGPHVVLGKHNYSLRYTAPAIATRLGKTLVAPVLPYSPQGDISPPSTMMLFPGTLALRSETFVAVLEDTARSLKQHGFKTICFVGENGPNQLAQKAVADKLTEEWKPEGVRVVHVNAYYDESNGQNDYLRLIKMNAPEPQAHGGLADTAEQMFVNPGGVRNDKRGPYTLNDFTALGVAGPSDEATAELGKKLIEMKIDAAVKQIEQERTPKKQ